MYKEIHTICNDLITPGRTVTIRLDSIKMLIPEELKVKDRTISYWRIRTTESYQDDMLISAEEGATINKELLRSGDAGLTREVSALTSAVRDLWQLLRARMH